MQVEKDILQEPLVAYFSLFGPMPSVTVQHVYANFQNKKDEKTAGIYEAPDACIKGRVFFYFYMCKQVSLCASG